MRLEHPIFQGPLAPGLELVDVDVPENYSHWPDGKDLGKTMRGWKVQSGKLGFEVDYGLVSDPYGFEDSPDAEWISSGLNSKGPNSVALGRHGNLFLWGFAGDPTQMTESGRRVFLNTIVYMRAFAGRTPLVKKRAQSREWALVYVDYLRQFAGKLDENEWLKKLFPVEITGELGFDPEKLEAYYRENVEFLHSGKEGFEADPDLLELGAPNRSLAFFEKVIERLRKDPGDALALRLLERYAPDASERDPAKLATWLEQNREHLFFSDVGGYRWFVAPARTETSKPHEAAAPLGSR